MPRPVDPNAKVELLRAAEAVFVEHGLEKARVEEITARAGRSKGSFYLHFESKEEAFRQIVETMLARLAAYVDAMDPESLPDGARLSEVADRYFEHEVELFDFLWQNRGVARMLLSGGGSAQFGYLIDAFAERSRARTRRWLELGVSRGHYRSDLDPEVASLVISGAYDRLARQLVRLDKKPDLRAWVRGVQRVLLLGIAAPGVDVVLDPAVSEPSPLSTASPAPRGTTTGGPASVPRNQTRTP